MGAVFLIVVDVHSKLTEVHLMLQITASKTIDLLKMFSMYSLPEEVVTKHGPQFVSEEFSAFMKMYGIMHNWCAPYHLSSMQKPS